GAATISGDPGESGGHRFDEAEWHPFIMGRKQDDGVQASQCAGLRGGADVGAVITNTRPGTEKFRRIIFAGTVEVPGNVGKTRGGAQPANGIDSFFADQAAHETKMQHWLRRRIHYRVGFDGTAGEVREKSSSSALHCVVDRVASGATARDKF